jgi:ribonucleoside-diphosphate reductase alpha chain
MTAKSSGIGVELKTRAPKDPVKNGKISHGGKYSYYSYLDRSVKANRQEVRGGSATVTFNALDPEVLDLLTLKQQRTDPSYRLDHMDYSMAVNHLLLKKAAKNEQWMTVSPYVAKDLWDLSYSGNQEAFEEEYERVLKSQVKKQMVNARDIISSWVTARGDSGRVYITFLDNVNSHTPFKDPIRLSNLCVAPETEILTDVGYVRIDEVENQKVNVWNGSEFSEVVVVKTGENQQLLTINTDSGQSLTCTHYHKFYVFDGYGKPYVEKRAKDLRAGDKLMKFDLPIIEGTETLNDAYANGFYSGDGCLTPTGQRIYLYGEKMKLKHLFSCKFTEGNDRMYGHYKTLKDKFFVPLNEYTVESRLEWLAGFLDADGCVYRNGTNEAFTAASVNLPFLQDLQKMLQTLGIDSKIKKMDDAGFKPLPANDGSGELKDFFCQAAYRILISSGESQKLLDMGIKTHRLKMEKRTPQRDARRFIRVADVVDEGRTDDTFCFNEPKRHLGMFNGILTGQCQEVMLPTSPYDDVSGLYDQHGHGEVALCNLGSIVVSNIEDDKDYEETAYILAKITDNTIEKGIYPFPQVEYTAKRRRSIGIGMTDLAHLMAKNDLQYDTEEGRNFIHALSEKHSYFLHKASVRLARERGKCEWWDKTKYAEGWLPIDTYAKSVDECHSEPLHMDWASLRNDIKTDGVRFSVLESFMPTESSSLLTNSCNGVYPVRKTEIFKSSKKGSVYFRAPDFEIFDYQNAYEIHDLDMVKVYSIIQKFTGQGISADFYSVVDGTTTKLSLKSMLQRVLYAAKMGMKTMYYENFKTDSGEVELADSSCESCKL